MATQIQYVISLLLTLTLVSGPAFGADSECEFPVFESMPGVNMYANPLGKGDVVDPAALEEHARQVAPLHRFVLSASNALDRPIPWADAPKVSRECILSTLRTWARGNALLKDSSDSGGSVGRVFFSVALNLMAAKLIFRGHEVDVEIVQWLKALSLAVTRQYRDYRFHGFYNNVNAWAGASAATVLVLLKRMGLKDVELEAAEAKAWSESLAGISVQEGMAGLVPGELKRGRNALTYSLFYYSGVLVHRQARRALGQIDLSYEWKQLRLFASRFGENFCGDATKDVFAKAGEAMSVEDERALKAGLGGYGLRVPAALMEGTLKNDAFKNCPNEVVPRGYVDVKVGGDTRYIPVALAAAAKPR
jgi:hypothetical protein